MLFLKTNEEYNSITYGCIKFIDSYRFLSMSLDGLVKTLDINFNISKKEFPYEWQYLNKKLAYSYGHFISIEDYEKAVNNLEKDDFFSKLKTLVLVMKQ